MLTANRRRRPCDSRKRGISLEALEDRRLLAVLSTGAGDGSLNVLVDGYGSYGWFAFDDFTAGAIFDPIGIDPADLTVAESAVALRFGDSGSRQFLTSGDIFGDVSLSPLIDPGTTGDSTTAVSNFTIGGLSFQLTQSVAPVFGPNGQIGSALTQRYEMTNVSGSNLNFELVRFLNSFLFFDGNSEDGGGRLVSDGREYLFETDAATDAFTPTNYVAIDSVGGTHPATGRYEIDQYGLVGRTVGLGLELDDSVFGDNNQDGFVDVGFDYFVNQAFRNVYSLSPGASATYRTRTIFATGAPVDVPTERTVSVGSDMSTFEGDAGLTPLVFSISLDKATNSLVTANYTVEGITATSGVDFVAQSGTLTFAPGESTQLVTVQVSGDLTPENNETFRLRLTSVVGGVAGRSEAIGTIYNDDVELSIGDISIIEGNTGTKDAVFTVSAVGQVVREVSFGYTTTDGSANAGSDYLARGGTGVIHPGATSATIVVPIVGDIFNELHEDFFMVLTSAQNARIVDGLAVGTILNNDPLPNLYVNDPVITSKTAGTYQAVFTVALDAPSGRQVQVAYATADGGAVNGVDYLGANGTLTFAPGVTHMQVSIPVTTVDTYFPNKKFYLNLFGATNSLLVDSQGAATIVYDDDTFGEYIVDNGDAAFTKNAGWTNLTNTLAYQLDYDYAAAGNGSAKANWNFVGIPNGSYEVFARWSHFGNRATNAPFTMLDNGVPIGTVLVNQQLAPTGEYSDGVYWQSLGFFSTTTNNFAVQLTNAANGYVVADAIRIVAGGIGPQTAEMDVSSNQISIVTGDTTPQFADGTRFGQVPVFTDSSLQKFTIENNGNADLHLTGVPRVTISGAHASDFTVMTQPASTIAPGKKSTFEVMFHPQGVGLRTATISIANNDDSEHPYTFAIEGNGFAEAVPLAHNAAFPQDVNNDGRVSTSDALLIINRILAAPSAQPLVAGGEASPLAATTVYADVNGDTRLSASDLLMVFNYLLLKSASPQAQPAAELAAPAVDEALVLFDEGDEPVEVVAAKIDPAVQATLAARRLEITSPLMLVADEALSLIADDDAGEESAE